MSNQVDLGDPGKATTFSFNLPMPDSSGGYVVVINESPYGLRFSIPVGTGTLVFKVPSDSWRQVTINGRVIGSVQWSIANSVNTAVAPLSDVAVECYGLNECPNVSMGVISRQTNVGNSVPVGTQTTQVLNDGNSAPTVVAEGTPSGATGSQLKWNNDGSGIFGGGKASVTNAGILTLPAGAVPVASISAGNLPATTTVPLANLNAGALPAGVTLPVAQLSGTLPAAQVGSGYPGGSVNGAVASATNLTALTADVEGGNLVVIRPSPTTDATILQTSDGTNSHNFTFGADGSLALQSSQVRAPGAVLGPLTIGSAAPYVLVSGGGGFSSFYGVSGSGSATVSISMPIAPFAALVNSNNGSNSTTFGSGSYTTTSVFIYQYTAMAWRAMLYV